MDRNRKKDLEDLVKSNEFKIEEYKKLPIEELYYLHKRAEEILKDLQVEDEQKKYRAKSEFFYAMAIEALKSMKSFYSIFFTPTTMPYVVCDEESFDDEVLIYSSLEKVKESVLRLQKAGEKVQAVEVKQEQFLVFFSNMFCYGANALLLDEQDSRILLSVDRICKRPDEKSVENKAALVSNPSFQLTTMYFMQEMHKDGQKDEQKAKELQEELLVNLTRGVFLLPVFKETQEEGMQKVPYLKNKEGDVYLPIFTDMYEFAKYNKNNQFHVLILKFMEVLRYLREDLKGISVNPFGNNLLLLGDVLRRLTHGKNPAQ